MGSHRDRQPLVLRPRPSRHLIGYALVIHLLAAGVVLLLPIGWWRLPLLLPILLGAIHVHALHVARWVPWAVVEMVWGADGTWTLTFQSGRQQEARLLSSTFVSLPLVVLNFRVGRLGWRSVPLFADALEPERMRRLRLLLKSEGGRAGSASVPAA